jgi:hypothetical protein
MELMKRLFHDFHYCCLGWVDDYSLRGIRIIVALQTYQGFFSVHGALVGVSTPGNVSLPAAALPLAHGAVILAISAVVGGEDGVLCAQGARVG